MKHLKVKNLDPVLQNVARRAVCKNMIAKDDDYAENLLTHVDWSKCTDEERLKYAEWKYLVGTKFIPVVPNTHNDKEGCITDFFSDGELFQVFNEGIASGKNWVYHLGENKWAKIISRPDEKEETKEPEFQPGEIIDEYRNGEVYQPVIYRFFADGVHWVSKARADKAVFIPDEIRKIHPDPEKEIRKIAEQILGSHWEKSTGKEFDDMTKHHLKYAVDAIIEALKTEVE